MAASRFIWPTFSESRSREYNWPSLAWKIANLLMVAITRAFNGRPVIRPESDRTFAAWQPPGFLRGHFYCPLMLWIIRAHTVF
jgi:hypothetical protein